MNQSEREIRADFLVVGFGKGGKTVAAEMGRRGKRVVVVERSERMYGAPARTSGACPARGSSIVPPARFLDPHSVEVELTGERVRVSAEEILINSGSEPYVPDIPGLAASERTVTSTALIESTRLPERLAILGGGYLGIEFAVIYQRFGSRVQLIDAAPRLLGREDEDVAAAAIEILEREGIEIVSGAQVTAVRDEDDAAVLSSRGPTKRSRCAPTGSWSRRAGCR